MEYVLAYMVIGLVASIVSEAMIGWDAKDDHGLNFTVSPTNPGPFVRMAIIVLWPLFVLVTVGLVLDSFIKVAGRRLRKAFK